MKGSEQTLQAVNGALELVDLPTCPKTFDEALKLGPAQTFQAHVRRDEAAMAIKDGSRSLTYGELDKVVRSLVAQLCQNHSFEYEEPVAIMFPRDWRHIAAQLAVLYIGATCVPLDPSLPDEILQERIMEWGISFVMTDASNQSRCAYVPSLAVDENNLGILSGSDLDGRLLPSGSRDPDHRTHLMFTSGTTGKPKAVQVLAKSLLTVVFHTLDPPLGPRDVVAHVGHPTFDMATFEVWAPLLWGASLIVVDKEVFLDPPALANEIAKFEITTAYVTTAYVHLVGFNYPNAFSKLKTLLFGGEAVNIEAIARIWHAGPPQQLIHCYGPTETCIHCLTHTVGVEDLCRPALSIGIPLGRVEVFVLDERQTPVLDGETGELYIAGNGLSRGYLANPERNLRAFPTIMLPSPQGGTRSVKTYRTGDLVKRRANGDIEFVGRCDNQVKIRGYRIELGAVELALLNTGLCSQAVAFKFDPDEAGGAAVLMAFVVPTSDQTVSASQLTQKLAQKLPHYMIPQVEVVSKLPWNTSNKVDRKELLRLAHKTRQSRMATALDDTDKSETRSELSELKSLWLSVLALSKPDLQLEDDFFDLGGTSIQAAILVQKLRQSFATTLSMRKIYENSTLGAMAALLQTSNDCETATHDEQDNMINDSKLADTIALPTHTMVSQQTSDIEGKVLVTGSTGFLGAHLVNELLNMSKVTEVTCLVRANSASSGFARLKETMEKYRVWEDASASKLVVVCGNLRDETFGLGREAFWRLSCSTNAVFHLAARVNYVQPYSKHRPANVLGTLNVLRFMVTGHIKQLHYTSSIAAFGPTGLVNNVKCLLEDEPLDPHLEALQYDQGYSQSQWVAEQMLRRCMSRGFPIAIYRPGFVTGSTATGLSNRDDFLSRLMECCIETNSYPQLLNQSKEFVPVDYVAKVISIISSSAQNLNRCYNIVPPSHVKRLDLMQFFELLGSIKDGPRKIRGLPYKDWVAEVVAADPLRVRSLMPLFQEKVYQDKTRWEMYENMPIYDSTNTQQALQKASCELEFAPLDSTLLSRYMQQVTPELCNGY